MTVMSVITAALVVGLIIFMMGSRSRKVDQHDTYLAGEVYEHHQDLELHYSANFYRPIERLFEPYLRNRLERCYEGAGNAYEVFSELLRRLYSGDVQHYAYYVIGFLTFLIIAMRWLS
jgi:NADH-quinone oxidoreductase subunit M